MCQKRDAAGRCLDVINPIQSNMPTLAFNPLETILKQPAQNVQTTQTTSGGGGFLNTLEKIIPFVNTGVSTVTTLNTNKTNREIANKQAEIANLQLQAAMLQQGQNPYQPKKDNTILYVVIGVVVVGVIAYFAMKK